MIFFEDIRREVSSRVGGDYYVLPSSTHECIIVPASEWRSGDTEELHTMVHDVNHKCVGVAEILGESVYRYYADSEELAIVA